MTNRPIAIAAAQECTAFGVATGLDNIDAEKTMIELTESWADWRQGVVAVIRSEFRDIFDHVEDTDIDWEAWRPLYDEGRSPQAAVDKAFVRDL